MSATEGGASAAPAKSNGLAIAALIVGIAAVLSGWVPFWGFVVGVAAIILGIIGLKKSGQKGMSIAGIITGAIGALWSLVISVIVIMSLVTLSVGGAVISGALNQELASQQARTSGQKNFSKGETATFGDFEVTVNKVITGYEPNSILKPDEGNQYIVVDLTVKNISDSSQYVSQFDFDVAVNGVDVNSSFLSADQDFKGSQLQAGASVTGTIVYEVPLDASNLKLTYETYGYDNGEFKMLTYTLDI